MSVLSVGRQESKSDTQLFVFLDALLCQSAVTIPQCAPLYAYDTNLNQTFLWYDPADKNSREFVLTRRIPSVNNRFKTSYLVL